MLALESENSNLVRAKDNLALQRKMPTKPQSIKYLGTPSLIDYYSQMPTMPSYEPLPDQNYFTQPQPSPRITQPITNSPGKKRSFLNNSVEKALNWD